MGLLVNICRLPLLTQVYLLRVHFLAGCTLTIQSLPMVPLSLLAFSHIRCCGCCPSFIPRLRSFFLYMRLNSLPPLLALLCRGQMHIHFSIGHLISMLAYFGKYESRMLFSILVPVRIVRQLASTRCLLLGSSSSHLASDCGSLRYTALTPWEHRLASLQRFVPPRSHNFERFVNAHSCFCTVVYHPFLYIAVNVSLAFLISFLCIYCFCSFALYFPLNSYSVWICRVHHITIHEYIFVPLYAYFG